MPKHIYSPHDSQDGPRRSGPDWATKQDLKKLERLILMTQKELADGLKQIQTQAAKIGNEQAARFDAAQVEIARLGALITEGGDITPEVVDAYNGAKTAMQTLDDVIPDPVPAA